ncbi:MAG: methyltransferase [Oscillospiraceae bacterium]|nr:methyltransferase [Oscillospiraceae bacterium]
MERRDLLFEGGFTLIYDDALTKPGTDSFLLSAFPKLRRGLRCADLGAGGGLLGLLLLSRERELCVDGVEICADARALAEKNAAENGIADRLKTYIADIRSLGGVLDAGKYDLVVSNPPYFRAGSGESAADDNRRAAREESLCEIGDVFSAASRLLRWGGKFCLVYRPERLADVVCAARDRALEPKRLRFVCLRPERAPSLLLLECAKGGGAGLKVEPPLILRDENGRDTPEVEKIYFRRADA